MIAGQNFLPALLLLFLPLCRLSHRFGNYHKSSLLLAWAVCRLGPKGSQCCLQLPSQSQEGLVWLRGEQEPRSWTLNRMSFSGKPFLGFRVPQCSGFTRSVGKVTKSCVISAKDFLPKAVFLNALSFNVGDGVLLSGSAYSFNFLRQVIQLASCCWCMLCLMFPSLKI